jgi:hypothetical protein
LYQRVTITCQTATGSGLAWTYRYARCEQLQMSLRIAPNLDTGQTGWPPRDF